MLLLYILSTIISTPHHLFSPLLFLIYLVLISHSECFIHCMPFCFPLISFSLSRNELVLLVNLVLFSQFISNEMLSPIFKLHDLIIQTLSKLHSLIKLVLVKLSLQWLLEVVVCYLLLKYFYRLFVLLSHFLFALHCKLGVLACFTLDKVFFVLSDFTLLRRLKLIND